MEDICVPYFTGKGCSQQPCPNAHTFEQLCNQDHWVLFDAAHIDMVDFIAYKYQVHHYFKCHFLPNQGPLVRFATCEDAKNVIMEYKDYYSPRLLVDLYHEDHTTSNSEQTETHSLTKSGSSNSLDKFESSSSASNNNSLSWPTNTQTNICWADEVEDLPLEELSENELPLENTLNAERNKEVNTNLNQKSKSRKSKSNRNKGEDDHKSSKGSRKPPIYGKNQPFRGPPTKTPSNDINESCTERVLKILRENEKLRKEHATGWVALKSIWNISEGDLDEAVLNCLSRKTAAEQEHILLSFAAIELSNVMNLSAYLNCLIKEHDGTNQVCLYFLADLCHDPECTYVHPVNTGGWDVLYKKWQITYRDLDYGVLNYLSKKSEKDQNEILCSLADMNLNAIHNLSAYLSSMIQKHESNKTGKRSSEAVKNKRSQNHGRKQNSSNAVESNTNSIPNNTPINNTNSITPTKTESILVPPYFPVWSAPNMAPPVWVHPALISRGF